MNFQNKLEQKGSVLITADENQTLFGYLQPCDSYSLGAGVGCTAVVRNTQHVDEDICGRISSKITLAKRSSFKCTTYNADVSGNENWNDSVFFSYNGFELRKTQEPKLLTFKTGDNVFGLNFAETEEAMSFKFAVDDRKNTNLSRFVRAPTQLPVIVRTLTQKQPMSPVHQPPPIHAFTLTPLNSTTTTQSSLPHSATPEKKENNSSLSWFDKGIATVKRGLSKHSKLDINAPTNFEHRAHIGWNSANGLTETLKSEFDNTVREPLREIGYQPENMNKVDYDFVCSFVDEYGGIEAVRESLATDHSNNRKLPPSRELPKPPSIHMPIIIPPKPPTRPIPHPVTNTPKFGSTAQATRAPGPKKVTVPTIPQLDHPITSRATSQPPAPLPVFKTDIKPNTPPAMA